MALKNINAGLALVTVAAGLVHIIYNVIAYLLMFYNETAARATSGIFMTLVMIHAVLGIISITVPGDGSALMRYPRQNITTIIQRISGILILPLVFLHTKTFGLLQQNITSGNMGFFWLLIVLQMIFFGDVLLHIGLSISRALITLGFLTSSSKKERVDRLVCAACGCLFVAATIVVTRFDIMLIRMAGDL